MKKIFNFKNAAMLIALLFTTSSAFATIFTATTSGSWSSSTTWGGSAAPSYNVSTDQITIPAGIAVALGNNLSINGPSASLTVLGSITDNASDSLLLGSGTLTGTGSITVNTLVTGVGATMVFNGMIAVQTLTNMSAAISLTAHTTVSQSLNLAGGVLAIGSGGALTVASNATVVVSGGSMVNNGGSLTFSGTYNVMYMSSSATTGDELTGTQLNNVTINVSSGNSVTMSSDLAVTGTLRLTSGTLAINSHNLTLSGDIASGGSGSISAGSGSNLTISMTASPSGSLNFTPGSDSLNHMTLNIGGGGNSMLSLGSDLYIDSSLTFGGNGSLNTQQYGLHMGSGAIVTGADSSAYVIATGGGYMAMQMTTGSSTFTTFPIGTNNNYSPISGQLNSGSASGSVSASAADGVYSHGTGGSDISLSQAAVGTTYFIEPDNNTNSSMNLRLEWLVSAEHSGFNHDSAYLSHYTNGAWDNSAVGSATASGNLYFMERDNITSFSPFAVFGKGAQTATTGIATVSAADIVVYPNPVSNNLMIRNIANGDSYTMDIIDITGQTVASYKVSAANNTVSVAGLTEGNYFVKLSNGQMSTVKKFVKM